MRLFFISAVEKILDFYKVKPNGEKKDNGRYTPALAARFIAYLHVSHGPCRRIWYVTTSTPKVHSLALQQAFRTLFMVRPAHVASQDIPRWAIEVVSCLPHTLRSPCFSYALLTKPPEKRYCDDLGESVLTKVSGDSYSVNLARTMVIFVFLALMSTVTMYKDQI
ncbi:hypothetical protein SERLA73DRAFT_186856, partial [Serpula lacrymans var. lacrymans S7.3]